MTGIATHEETSFLIRMQQHFAELPVGKALTDTVHHPPHYTGHPSGIECIEITKHMNFCLGNVVKYVWRADQKGDPIENLLKAREYLNYEIERRQQAQPLPLARPAPKTPPIE